MFNNKTILITGGTGSFGNAVLNRFLTTDIGAIRTLSCDEKKQDATITSRIDARVDVLGYPNTLHLRTNKLHIRSNPQIISIETIFHGYAVGSDSGSRKTTLVTADIQVQLPESACVPA